ncbi:MAG: carboxypeptidase-like regulatory domain-containing protein [Fidelibacterota bacterium]
MQRKFYVFFLKAIKLSLFFLFFYHNSTVIAQTSRLTGIITDGKTGETLIGANVFFQETGRGMATDRNGYYVIDNIEADSLTLIVSFLGYVQYKNKIHFTADRIQRINISLNPEVLTLAEVDVSAEKIARQFNIQPSRVNLSTRQIRSIPSVLEPDIFRTIQALPGVLTPSEFSTGLIIRGGNTDQNLILLDGITVYNPSHLGGVFSNFIVDAIKDAELIKGGYNAEYGGRLSAVLNVTSREGNSKKFDAKMNISILSAQTTLEGPIPNGAWLVSGRRTYFDKVLEQTDFNVPPYYFYDLQGHVFTDITSKDRVSISFYNGKDVFVFDDLGMDTYWGNETISSSYRRIFNDLLVGNFLLASSRFFTFFNLGGESGIIQDNTIHDLTASANLTYFQNDKMTWKFGGHWKELGFNYDNAFADSSIFVIKKSPVETAAYVKLKWIPRKRFIIEPGFRMNSYNAHPDKFFPDLRLGLKYLLTKNRYINFALGNYHQFIMTVQDDYNPTLLDFWMAIDESVDPGKSIQVVLGYEEYFGEKYKLQIETYYKDLKNMLTFVDTRASSDEIISDEKLTDMFDEANGYAYGFEVFAQKLAGRLNGWVSYTYSISRKLMGGKEYFTNWDRRHAFTIIGSYHINKKWELNWQWSYQSGQAFTPILGYYIENLDYTFDNTVGGFSTIPGSRNSGRYPDYHRLDLGAVRHFKLKKMNLDLYLQVINSYNRDNIFRYFYTVGNIYNGLDDDADWEKDKHDTNGNGYPDPGEPNVDEPDEGKVTRSDISVFPIIPSIGINISF